MVNSIVDVFGIGNAIVDTVYVVDDAFLDEHGISKGHMQLVDDARIGDLTRSVGGEPNARMSGGSVANTIYACRGFGCTAHVACRVADDVIGRHFKADLEHEAISCSQFADSSSMRSGQCLVLITPDGERSMNTCLGVSERLSRDQVDQDTLERSKHLYIEGYLASSPSGSDAACHARELAEANDVQTSLTLSDASMINHFREPLERMLGNGVDHVFCNEEEALLWCGTDRVDVAFSELRDIGGNVFMTLSERGSITNVGNDRIHVPAVPTTPVDVNGAGDIFAGGVLAALVHGADNISATRFGNFAAASLITEYGARFSGLDRYQELQAATDVTAVQTRSRHSQ